MKIKEVKINYKKTENKDYDKITENIDVLRFVTGCERKSEFKGCLFVHDYSFEARFNLRNNFSLDSWLLKCSFYCYNSVDIRE